jgi:hypothetical protein
MGNLVLLVDAVGRRRVTAGTVADTVADAHCQGADGARTILAMRWWLGLVWALCVAAGVAQADIYEWTDDSGARHFANHRESIPDAQRDSARVLIIDVPHPASEPVATAQIPLPADAAVARPEPPAWDAAYLAGLQAGLRLEAGGGGGGAAAGGAVQIHGPLAVATSHASESAPFGAPFGGWYAGSPDYYPFVTTGFDRGRSRHQTLRMLLQDQFAIDRDGPYAYDRWNQPGVGPALAPFLPRGLPLPVQQYGRVIYR